MTRTKLQYWIATQDLIERFKRTLAALNDPQSDEAQDMQEPIRQAFIAACQSQIAELEAEVKAMELPAGYYGALPPPVGETK